MSILSMFGQVGIVAALAGIATEVIKRTIPEKFQSWWFYGAITNITTVILSFFLTFVGQRLGWIAVGWEWTVASGILAAGLAVLGYEGVTNIIRGVAGDSVGDDKVSLRDVYGGNVNIGDG